MDKNTNEVDLIELVPDEWYLVYLVGEDLPKVLRYVEADELQWFTDARQNALIDLEDVEAVFPLPMQKGKL